MELVGPTEYRGLELEPLTAECRLRYAVRVPLLCESRNVDRHVSCALWVPVELGDRLI
jgi:hypothetical protein